MTQRPAMLELTRRRVLETGASCFVAAALSASGRALADEQSWRTGRILRWSPPLQKEPEIVLAGSRTFLGLEFPRDQDVVLEFPKTVRPPGSDVQIVGGRHVRIVGGHIQGRLQWKDGTGSIFIEGLLIDLTEAPNRDAIAISGAEGFSPDVYIQNTFVTGVQGTFAGMHADVFQPYGPLGHLRVHALTADTNYQGFFIRPKSTVVSATFSRVNMKFNRLGRPAGNTFLFWTRNMAGSKAMGDPYFPVEYGPDVYAEANDRAPGLAAAFPPPDLKVPGPDGRDFDGIVGTNGLLRWPEQSGIKGEVMLGTPPGGDFVRRETVGVDYRSPGYA